MIERDFLGLVDFHWKLHMIPIFTIDCLYLYVTRPIKNIITFFKLLTREKLRLRSRWYFVAKEKKLRHHSSKFLDFPPSFRCPPIATFHFFSYPSLLMSHLESRSAFPHLLLRLLVWFLMCAVLVVPDVRCNKLWLILTCLTNF